MAKMGNDFAIFILTHGRPDNVRTVASLRSHGYTGRIVLLIDNEDKTADQYHAKYGKDVVVFDKLEAAKNTDFGDNFKKRNVVVFARNECFKIAKELGVSHFVQMDDDYYDFQLRFDEKLNFTYAKISNLDLVIDAVLKFHKKCGALATAFSQGGDFIGGAGAVVKNGEIPFKRKAMNSFFCATDRPINFVGRINEDVNAYCLHGQVGSVFIQIPFVSLNQYNTQSNSGGLTDSYLDVGTYVKSFYSAMYCPSFVKITTMGETNRRIHHRIKWPNAVPLILSESHKKK